MARLASADISPLPKLDHRSVNGSQQAGRNPLNTTQALKTAPGLNQDEAGEANQFGDLSGLFDDVNLQDFNTGPDYQIGEIGGQPSFGGSDFGASNIGGLDAFMGSLRTQESGGNYSILGPSTKYGKATGAYQFLDSTWRSVAGPEIASQYSSAYLAPPQVQDQVAQKYMTDLFNKYNDWSLVAIAWHAGPGVADKVASGQSLGSIGDGLISTQDYVDQILGRL